MDIRLYDFYDNDGKYDTIEETLSFLDEGNYEYEYTYGLGYRNPRINHMKISKDEAFRHIKNESFVTVDLNDNLVHVNAYSDNDMW